MKQSAEFLNDHNFLAIVDDLLTQPIDCFHHGWGRSVEVVARACWDVLQQYNQLLQGNDSACVESSLSKQRLLKQDLERLRSFAPSLWRSLNKEAQEDLWLEWLKAGLVQMSSNPTNAIVLGEFDYA